MKLSVVIPAYNESQNIRPTIEELLSVTDKTPAIDDVQIIVVDDHSTDNTFDVISQINDTRVSCIRLSRRSGGQMAVRAGTREADGDAILFICADGQEDPSCIPAMLEKWRSGVKVVWALRENRERESKRIRIPALLFYRFMNWLSGKENTTVDFYNADFWLFDRISADAFNACTETNASISGLIEWLGFKQDFVTYTRRNRRYGKSKWNFRSRLHSAKDFIIAFSGLPLKLMPLLGLFIAVLGFIFAVFIIVNYFTGNPMGGWSTIMVAILFLGGIQMIMLGIMGEYLWRNLEESRKRPLFFIEKRTTDIETIRS